MGTTDKDWRAAVFPSLLVVLVLAYAWRMSGVAPVPPVTDHLSNFYLTAAALTLLIGPRGFVSASRRARALVLAGILVGVNVVAEFLLAIGDAGDVVNRALGNVNTPDPVDGLFGIAATAMVVLLLPPPGMDDAVGQEPA